MNYTTIFFSTKENTDEIITHLMDGTENWIAIVTKNVK
jgi:hypothetical protein